MCGECWRQEGLSALIAVLLAMEGLDCDVVATNAGEAANMGDVEGLRSVQKRCSLAKSKCNMLCVWVGGYPQLLCVMCYGSSIQNSSACCKCFVFTAHALHAVK